MTDVQLSQDELNALLGGGSSEHKNLGDFNTFFSGALYSARESNLSAMANGGSASLIGGMVKVSSLEALKSQLPDNVIEFKFGISAGSTYEHVFLMDPNSAVTVARFLMQDPSVEMSEDTTKTVEELFSVFSSSFTGKFVENFGKQASILSASHLETFKDSLDLPSSLLVENYELTLGGEKVSFYEVFDDKILSLFEPAPKAQAPKSSASPEPAKPQATSGGTVMSDKNQTPNVQGVQFPNLANDEVMYEQGNIGLLMDVPMEVTVELGRAKRLIKDILSMGEGTIISLDKLAGEPIDILVNHKLIAKGEVVVIDENFGVRVTEILSGKENLFGQAE